MVLAAIFWLSVIKKRSPLAKDICKALEAFVAEPECELRIKELVRHKYLLVANPDAREYNQYQKWNDKRFCFAYKAMDNLTEMAGFNAGD